ncbi:MAG TPA: thioesterase family protein [Caulobacterales bacterium]|jgi:4-hydroxybenzoyl-CoA thioesterase|nr:thioesterase family protein [Caulobacterales bacterium]
MASITNRRTITIEWGQCDAAGIVFYPRYFEMIDHSTAVLFQAVLGVNKKQLQERYKGDMPLVGVNGKFLGQLTFGDVIDIDSEIAEFRGASFDVRHRIIKDGKVCVEAQETRVWIGFDENGAMKSATIPDEFRQKFFN